MTKKSIHIYMTEVKKAEIKAKAKALGLTSSAYIGLVLEGKIKVK